jgi:hypothetical protein
VRGFGVLDAVFRRDPVHHDGEGRRLVLWRGVGLGLRSLNACRRCRSGCR